MTFWSTPNSSIRLWARWVAKSSTDLNGDVWKPAVFEQVSDRLFTDLHVVDMLLDKHGQCMSFPKPSMVQRLSWLIRFTWSNCSKSLLTWVEYLLPLARHREKSERAPKRVEWLFGRIKMEIARDKSGIQNIPPVNRGEQWPLRWQPPNLRYLQKVGWRMALGLPFTNDETR